VQLLHKNSTGESYCGFHVLKIRKRVRYLLRYVCGKLFAKGNYYSIEVYKGLETKTIVYGDIYHDSFPTFRNKLEFELSVLI